MELASQTHSIRLIVSCSQVNVDMSIGRIEQRLFMPHIATIKVGICTYYWGCLIVIDQ